jgi:membrane-bound ClpP family serine protease
MAVKKDNKPVADFAFGRENYMLMIIGMVVIIFGFILMSGGGSKDPNVFNPEIFSARRITVAPIVVMLGFVIEIAAILRKTKEE